MQQVILDFELNGIDISNIVDETTGARPRRAAASLFLDTQHAVEKREKKEEHSDDEEPLVIAPLVVKPAAIPVGQYNLADSDSD